MPPDVVKNAAEDLLDGIPFEQDGSNPRYRGFDDLVIKLALLLYHRGYASAESRGEKYFAVLPEHVDVSVYSLEEARQMGRTSKKIKGNM